MWYPLPENTKNTKCSFHVFDRHGIHIQALVHSINGNESLFNPHLHKKYCKKCILKLCFKQNNFEHFHKYFSKQMWVCIFNNFETFQISRYAYITK